MRQKKRRIAVQKGLIRDLHLQVARGLVVRMKYRMEGNRLLPDPSPQWMNEDWLKNPTYDPFERYYQGDTPHLDFLNLTRDSKPEKVLDFVNAWGLPRLNIKTVDQVIEEAGRMHNYACIIDLLRGLVPGSDPSTVEQLRTLVSEMRQAGMWWEIPAEELIHATEGAIRSVPESVAPSSLKQQALRSLAEGASMILEIAQDPTRLPDEDFIPYVRSVVTHLSYHYLKSASPTLDFYDDRKTKSSRILPIVKYVAPDLLTSLYVMLTLDLPKEQLRKCQNINCSQFFLSTRKDQIYHSSYCAHAMAMRSYRAKKLKPSKPKKGGKHHGRVSKK